MELTTEVFDLKRITREVVELQVSHTLGMIEIGKRLILAKENLAHGEFSEWLDGLCFSHQTANKYMQAARQFGHLSATSRNLSPSQVLEMCLLPPEIDREAFAEDEHVIPSTGAKKRGYDLTVRELREVRKVIRKKDKPAALPALPIVYEASASSGDEEFTVEVLDAEPTDGIFKDAERLRRDDPDQYGFMANDIRFRTLALRILDLTDEFATIAGMSDSAVDVTEYSFALYKTALDHVEAAIPTMRQNIEKAFGVVGVYEDELAAVSAEERGETEWKRLRRMEASYEALRRDVRRMKREREKILRTIQEARRGGMSIGACINVIEQTVREQHDPLKNVNRRR